MPSHTCHPLLPRAAVSFLSMLVVGGCFHPHEPPQLESETQSSSSGALTGSDADGVDTRSETSAADDSGAGGTGTNSAGIGDSGGDTSTSGEGEDPSCGNGMVEAGEYCDDEVESATCDGDCTEVVCGDLHINGAADEECEGAELGGGTCEGLGFDGGSLACDDGCAYDTSGCGYLPSAPVLELGFSQIKHFEFSWAAAAGADRYQLRESIAPGDPFVQLGADIVGQAISVEQPLHLRYQASYVLRACNMLGCTESAPVDVVDSMVEAVGYFKASNTGANDSFGYSVDLSDDGTTLVIGAYQEDSQATGIDGDQADNGASEAGAVYVFVRNGVGQWLQQAYIKASNSNWFDRFGYAVALSGDGDTLAIGAYREDSSATGIGGNQADDSASSSGAVYVLVRNGAGEWSQQAYIKASNTGDGDDFGAHVALSDDGDTLAVGAPGESSNGSGVGAAQGNDLAADAGAVYVFARNGANQWAQQAYIKASNTDANDRFGTRVALSSDGNDLAVSATGEDSSVTGIGGNQGDDSAVDSGAVYVLTRNGVAQWSQQAYVKASNTDAGDVFGSSLAISGDGSTLVVGAYLEDSAATNVDGNQSDDSAVDSGAVYVLVRDGVGQWSHQAYVKASNTGAGDHFGARTTTDESGDVVVIAAYDEPSNATGIGGNQADASVPGAGAVYVLMRDPMDQWLPRAYVKASNAGMGDLFGTGLAISGDGDTLAVGAQQEDSAATGVGSNQADDFASGAGAVYLF